jgi:hypothetical protein
LRRECRACREIIALFDRCARALISKDKMLESADFVRLARSLHLQSLQIKVLFQ